MFNCCLASSEHFGTFSLTLSSTVVYAKAQNLCRALTREYDNTLADVDVLAMPTTP
jgi:Asp-tRNA(Asn)/Glu-tRNA(Gln) amidotransferase A subunit family amidase